MWQQCKNKISNIIIDANTSKKNFKIDWLFPIWNNWEKILLQNSFRTKESKSKSYSSNESNKKLIRKN